jgi:hypothetical protein
MRAHALPANSPILRGDDGTVRVMEAALSTDDRLSGHEGTGDVIEHEQTFERFLSVIAIAAQHAASCLIALAIWGFEGHALVAGLFFILASMAAVAGLSSRSIGWKPGGVVLALEIVAWVLLA